MGMILVQHGSILIAGRLVSEWVPVVRRQDRRATTARMGLTAWAVNASGQVFSRLWEVLTRRQKEGLK
jgi:hypothetical protein